MSKLDYVIKYQRASMEFRALGCWAMADYFDKLCAEIMESMCRK